MNANTIIVTAETFDPKKLSFGEAQPLKLAKANMNKIPIKYDGKDLVIQTPIFKRCSIRSFEKKSEDDKNNIVMYQSIQYKDEEDYAHKVIERLSEAVKAHIKTNVRSLFNRKKDSMADLTFNAHIQEPQDYCASIKTNVPMASRDKAEPHKNVHFYRDTNEELTTQEMMDILAESNSTVPARSLISVPYAYTLNKQQYGFKTFLCSLDLKEKPEGAQPIEDTSKLAKESGSGEASSSALPNLGCAFI